MVFRKMESLIRECFEKEFEGEGVNKKKNTIVVSAFGSVPFGTYFTGRGHRRVHIRRSRGFGFAVVAGTVERVYSEEGTRGEEETDDEDDDEEEDGDEEREDEECDENNNERRRRRRPRRRKSRRRPRRRRRRIPLRGERYRVIHADVRLLKCVVDGIVTRERQSKCGLATLAFLKEVNAKIGKNDLFKRSVILVKAWAFYESRILGAPYALLSTYALKTLIICALRRFNKKESKSDATKTKKREIATPLDVLRIFLNTCRIFRGKRTR